MNRGEIPLIHLNDQFTIMRDFDLMVSPERNLIVPFSMQLIPHFVPYTGGEGSNVWIKMNDERAVDMQLAEETSKKFLWMNLKGIEVQDDVVEQLQRLRLHWMRPQGRLEHEPMILDNGFCNFLLRRPILDEEINSIWMRFIEAD